MIRKIPLATLAAGERTGAKLGISRALLGLATRFTLMAIMASIFAAAAGHPHPLIRSNKT